MELLIIEDNVVKPTEEAKLIYPFRQIWERDKSQKKEIAGKEIAFIEFFCSLGKRNPYAGYTDDEIRMQKITDALFRDYPEWQPDALIEDGKLVYYDMMENASPSLALYKAARQGIEKFKGYFETLDMTKVTKTGVLVNKPSEVANALKQVGPILTEFDALEKKVQQELLSGSKTRNNRVVNHFEK